MKSRKLIDEYINKLPQWSREICVELRRIIHNADTDIVEDWKWGQPAFAFGNKQLCWVWAFKKHVDFTFYQGALMKDSHKLFNYGKQNLRNRSIKFTDVSQIDKNTLIDYVREAVRLNKEGKQVKIPISKDKTVIMPDYIKMILQKENLLEKFESQIFTYRKGYIRWIEEAKQEKTKQKRIDQMIKELKAGKYYMNMLR